MIARLIDWCIHNRAMVLLLTLFLIAAGVWAVFSIKLDAIPDLSDVQVIVSVDYAGQSPRIIEDQVTNPLTRAMLAVPKAKVVRGYSMFGACFVYVIFEDGTDIYWARSRVQESMNSVSLPAGVQPRLGPDATGVGWIYEYVLTTGQYCPDHPGGLWHDPVSDKWFARAGQAPADSETQKRLIHHRVFQPTTFAYFDQQELRRYDRPQDAPAAARGRLQKIEIARGYDRCPLDGKALLPSGQDLSHLRSLQDWYLRYELKPIEGVSEVASIGGFEKQYQIVVDPMKLLAHNIALNDVRMIIEKANSNVGGRVVEFSEREYAVQGLGYLGTLSDQQLDAAASQGKSPGQARTEKVLADLRATSIAASPEGAPVRLGDVADIRLGPQMRRGALDWNGMGEAVGGIIIMRYGENARTTIRSVRQKLSDLEQGLPPGVAVETGYDRSDLIDRAVGTLSNTLLEEITVVALVCIIFLLHARSELVAVFVVPTAVLTSILAMHLLGINANVMSLGGIAIAIGVMVDSSIVMVENSHKHLDREEDRLHELKAAGLPAQPRPRTEVIAEAAKEVGPSLFFALIMLTASFLPVFVLGEQSGRLFKPLAFTKTFAMFASSFLAITIIPVLMSLFITARVLPKRWGWVKNLSLTLAAMIVPAVLILLIPWPRYGEYRHWFALGWFILMGMLLVPQKIIHENVNPISKIQQWLYHPIFVLVMRFRWVVLTGAVLAIVSIVIPYGRLGSEFMPPLEEGDLLYMPTTDPGISMTKARELLQQTDKLIKQMPEVQSVMGKIGRAETATDPAPVSMFETTIMLHRDKSRWRRVQNRPITVDELVYGYDLPDFDGPHKSRHMPGLNEIVQVPGLTNSWTMPIRTRIDMLSTGIKTPVGIKIMGPDLATLSALAERAAQVLKTDALTGPHTTSAFAEKTLGGSYLDIFIDRDKIARYNIAVKDVQDVIGTALGGMDITQTVEGLERYSVNMRYPQDLRDSMQSIKSTLVGAGRTQIPLDQLATFQIRPGPDMIRSENARPSSWVYVDIADIDVGTYVRNAQKAMAENINLPAGYSVVWSGQYQYIQEANSRLMIAIPMTFVLIVLLLYMASHSWLRVCIVLLAVPFSLVGAFWLVYLLHYDMSLAVWVGIIALAGLDAETGMVMLLYLDNSFDRFRKEGRMRNASDLWHAVHDGAVKRIRPKTMTVATTFIGLVPLLWAAGAGADTMRRMAAPMIGGLATSFIMELLIYPVIFYTAKKIAMQRESRRGQPA
ncbi:MAG: efflux RND transporter permease subunit [Planctomycetaceae bacterium]|nr:efflux RND transporter permease subunit [Planctomycetaceae bacterium]